jgi:predicted transposase YbfD/YdcC
MTDQKPSRKHIHKSSGIHPGENFQFIKILRGINDPRGESPNFHHPLTTVLFITVVCSLCGSNDWEAIVIQAKAMADWIGKFVDLSQGIPCVKTFKRVFAILCPTEMENMLVKTMELLRDKKEGDVISFDGKALRGTRASEKGLTAIHMLNAWSKENGICIGHMKVDDKSNEITSMPALMNLLDLKGTIITADALNTQRNIAAKAIELGADYVLPVKGNQQTLLEEIELLFKDAQEHNFHGFDGDDFETFEKSHGRVEHRKYHSLDAEGLPSTKEWMGLRSVGMVTRKRSINEQTTTEIQYYISSCEIDARLLERVSRGHWGIENSLHYVLDVSFREDRIRYRDRVGAQNLAAVRKITLGALAKDKTLKCGKEGKRLVAATDPKYRESVLKILF